MGIYDDILSDAAAKYGGGALPAVGRPPSMPQPRPAAGMYDDLISDAVSRYGPGRQSIETDDPGLWDSYVKPVLDSTPVRAATGLLSGFSDIAGGIAEEAKAALSGVQSRVKLSPEGIRQYAEDVGASSAPINPLTIDVARRGYEVPGVEQVAKEGIAQGIDTAAGAVGIDTDLSRADLSRAGGVQGPRGVAAAIAEGVGEFALGLGTDPISGAYLKANRSMQIAQDALARAEDIARTAPGLAQGAARRADDLLKAAQAEEWAAKQVDLGTGLAALPAIGGQALEQGQAAVEEYRRNGLTPAAAEAATQAALGLAGVGMVGMDARDVRRSMAERQRAEMAPDAHVRQFRTAPDELSLSPQEASGIESLRGLPEAPSTGPDIPAIEVGDLWAQERPEPRKASTAGPVLGVDDLNLPSAEALVLEDQARAEEEARRAETAHYLLDPEPAPPEPGLPDVWQGDSPLPAPTLLPTEDAARMQWAAESDLLSRVMQERQRRDADRERVQEVRARALAEDIAAGRLGPEVQPTPAIEGDLESLIPDVGLHNLPTLPPGFGAMGAEPGRARVPTPQLPPGFGGMGAEGRFPEALPEAPVRQPRPAPASQEPPADVRGLDVAVDEAGVRVLPGEETLSPGEREAIDVATGEALRQAKALREQNVVLHSRMRDRILAAAGVLESDSEPTKRKKLQSGADTVLYEEQSRGLVDPNVERMVDLALRDVTRETLGVKAREKKRLSDAAALVGTPLEGVDLSVKEIEKALRDDKGNRTEMKIREMVRENLAMSGEDPPPEYTDEVPFMARRPVRQEGPGLFDQPGVREDQPAPDPGPLFREAPARAAVPARPETPLPLAAIRRGQIVEGYYYDAPFRGVVKAIESDQSGYPDMREAGRIVVDLPDGLDSPEWRRQPGDSILIDYDKGSQAGDKAITRVVPEQRAQVPPEIRSGTPVVEPAAQGRPAAAVPAGSAITKPVAGRGGTKLVGYDWRSMQGERWSDREGGLVKARVSDWDRSDTSKGTGRDIVHVYYVQHPDGSITAEGIRSAANLLGMEQTQLQRIAKGAQAARQYQRETDQALAREHEKRSRGASDPGSSLQEAQRFALEDYVIRNDMSMWTEKLRESARDDAVLMQKGDRFVAVPSAREKTLWSAGWETIGRGVAFSTEKGWHVKRPAQEAPVPAPAAEPDTATTIERTKAGDQRTLVSALDTTSPIRPASGFHDSPLFNPERAAEDRRLEKAQGSLFDGPAEEPVRVPEAAAEPKRTFWKGDEAEYTGETRQLHGGTFHVLRLLEGHRKGEEVVTQRGPGEPPRQRVEPPSPRTPQVPEPPAIQTKETERGVAIFKGRTADVAASDRVREAEARDRVPVGRVDIASHDAAHDAVARSLAQALGSDAADAVRRGAASISAQVARKMGTAAQSFAGFTVDGEAFGYNLDGRVRLNILAELERAQVRAATKRTAGGASEPRELARGIVNVLVHEIAHGSIKGHGPEHAAEMLKVMRSLAGRPMQQLRASIESALVGKIEGLSGALDRARVAWGEADAEAGRGTRGPDRGADGGRPAEAGDRPGAGAAGGAGGEERRPGLAGPVPGGVRGEAGGVGSPPERGRGGADVDLSRRQAASGADPAETAGATRASEVEAAAREWKARGTESSWFRRWFGGSRITDTRGVPLVVYHGTTETRHVPGMTTRGDQAASRELKALADAHGVEVGSVANVFERWLAEGNAEKHGLSADDVSRARELTERARSTSTPGRDVLAFRAFKIAPGEQELGAHFGTRSQAQALGEPFGFYLKIQNPLRLPDLGTWGYQSVIREARKRGVKISLAEAEQIFNAPDSNAALRRLLLRRGYDGVVYRNESEGRGDSYIAFRPEQIKSVENRGTFSPTARDVNLMARQTAAERRSAELEDFKAQAQRLREETATTRDPGAAILDAMDRVKPLARGGTGQAPSVGVPELWEATRGQFRHRAEFDQALLQLQQKGRIGTTRGDTGLSPEQFEASTVDPARPDSRIFAVYKRGEPSFMRREGSPPPRTDLKRNPDGSLAFDEPPRVDGKVEDFYRAAREAGIKDIDLKRDHPRTWESLMPDVRRALGEPNAEAKLLKKATDGKLTDTDVLALDALRDGYRQQFERLKDERAKAADPGAVNAQIIDSAFRTAAVEYARVAKSDVQAGTALGRALAARRAVMQGFLKGKRLASAPDAFIDKVFRELPDVTPEQAAELARVATSNRPELLADALHAYVHPAGPRQIAWWLELWKASILSGPGTQVANISGNAVEVPMRVAETLTSAAVDAITSRLTGAERTRYAGEAGMELRGAMKGAKAGLPQLVADLKDIIHARPERVDLNARFEYQVGHISGKKGRIIRTPFRLLQAADRFFKSLGNGAEMGKLAWREAERELGQAAGRDAIRARAAEITEEASRPEAGPKWQQLLEDVNRGETSRVFQDDPAGIVHLLLRARAQYPVLHFVLPFVQTPANIASLTLERLGGGFLAARKTMQALEQAKAAGAPDAAISRLRGQAMDELARPTFGLAMMTALAGAAAQGALTGSGPADQEEKAALRETGWQPYSVRIDVGGGRSVFIPYNRLEPASSLVGIAADLVESKDSRRAADLFAKGMASIAQNITSKSYLEGLSNAVEVIHDPARSMRGFVAGLAGSLVPNIVASASRAVDPAVRDVAPDTAGLSGMPDAAWRKIVSRIPGASFSLPQRLGPTGERIERPGSAVERFLLPSQVSATKGGKEVEAEIARVGGKAAPGSPSRDMVVGQGRKVRLTDEEFLLLGEGMQRAAERVRKLMDAPAYRALPDTEDEGGANSKEAKIRRIWDQAREESRARVRRLVLRRLAA